MAAIIMASRSKSSARWLKEHFSDPYVKRAQAEGWRSILCGDCRRVCHTSSAGLRNRTTTRAHRSRRIEDVRENIRENVHDRIGRRVSAQVASTQACCRRWRR